MTFKVYVRATRFQEQEGRVGSYIITDQPDEYKAETPWPEAAEFTVSMRHDNETQQRRAFEYRDYLNKGLTIQEPIGTVHEKDPGPEKE